MIVMSDSLFGGLTFDPGFVRGSWERGWDLRIVRGGGMGDVKAVMHAGNLLRGREKVVICGGSNNIMLGRQWETKGMVWRVGMTSLIRLLREIIEEAVGRGIEVEVVIPPQRGGMDEARHGLVRGWISELVREWKRGVRVIELWKEGGYVDTKLADGTHPTKETGREWVREVAG